MGELGSRKICVMTGTRAEYGLLYWLMKDIEADPRLALQLIVSAMHLAPEFGHSIDRIRADGFHVDAEVPCLVSGDDNVALGKSMGLAHLGFVEALHALAPDILVLLGDRFEALSAATAATALRIPIAHIHGGETSEGAMDEYFRHAITKLARLHFVAAPEYARRVVQMGEQPESVHDVGALGLENFLRLELPDVGALSRDLGFDLSGRYVLLTYHPATLGDCSPAESLAEVLASLAAVPGLKVLATKANADPGGRAINAALEAHAAVETGRFHLVDTLGQLRYLAAMRGSAAVVGNSSSGLIEAPAVDVPTVNIGSRQHGRLKASSVVDCGDDRVEISRALERVLEPGFMAGLGGMRPPYGRPARIAHRIAGTLSAVDLDGLARKSFFDLNTGQN